MRADLVASHHGLLARAAAATLLLAGAAGAVLAQAPARDACAATPGGRTAEAGQYRIAWRSDPSPVPVGRLFALDLAVCSRATPGEAVTVSVDARMPAHGHGMNYKPGVKPVGDGRFRIEGMMFHMPGHWELAFELREGGRTERIVQPLTVR